MEIKIANAAGLDVTYWWMDFDGQRHYIGIVGKGDITTINSYPGLLTLCVHVVFISSDNLRPRDAISYDG